MHMGTISALALRPMVVGLDALGYPTDSILQNVGLSRHEILEPENRFPMPTAGGLWQAVLDHNGDRDIGLKLAQKDDKPDSLDVVGHLLMTSPTVGDAWRRLCHFSPLICSDLEMRLGEDKSGVCLEHRMRAPVPLPRCVSEYPLATNVLRLRSLFGDSWNPLEVRFAHQRPQDIDLHQKIFRCPIVFGAAVDALVVPQDFLQEPLSTAYPSLVAVLERYAQDQLARLPNDEVLDNVKNQIVLRLGDGEPRADQVARACGMSARTMHRRLKDKGTSYKGLVDELRLALAKQHLASGALSVAEIAFLLGFSEGRAFRRAFRRWTGKAPSSFR